MSTKQITSLILVAALVSTIGVWTWTLGIRYLNAKANDVTVNRDQYVEYNEELLRIRSSLKSIPGIELDPNWDQSGAPIEPSSLVLAVSGELIVYLNIPQDDPIRAMTGSTLRKELIHRIELEKQRKGFPTKGIELELADLKQKYSPNEDVDILLTLTGPGANPISGHRASLKVRWGRFKVAWREQSVLEPPADEELKTIQVDHQRVFNLKISAPEQPGDYTLHAVFDLYAAESGDALATPSIYSETKLLRVVK